MESLLITTEEIGNHRIKIYYDANAHCPCTNWDLAALYLFEYSRHNCLHQESNWEKLGVDERCDLNGALMKLADYYVPTGKIIEYFKKGTKEYFLRYNQSSRLWELMRKNYRGDDWRLVEEMDPTFLHGGGWNHEMLDRLENEELIELISNYGKDIFIKEWETRGYSQGDYVSGVAYCTKERYAEMCDKNTAKWKEKLDSIIDCEVEEIGMWMWGDVKGFVLEKKTPFIKTYSDGQTEEDFEWEEVDSCWGYFMETEELIREVISEYELKEEVA